MKPEKLLDGMQHISPEYITEAKPTPKQQTEAGIRKQNSAGKTDTVSVSHTPKDNDTKEKDYIMKKNSITRRIMTGFAATVACAVFACGGWFIYKQAQQQELNSDEQSVTEESQPDVQQVSTNFLGGQGKIRILGKGVLGEPDPDAVLYDDTRWYFRSASCYADRTGENADEYRSMPAEITAYYANVLNDGSNFYYADAQSLYTLDDDGTRSAEPVFQLTDDMLDPEKTAWRPLFSSEDTEADPGDSTQFFFRNIVPMSENKCLIVMSGPPEWFMAICDRETGDVQVLPISGLADPEPNDTVCSSFLPCADGSVMAVLNSATMKHAGIIRIAPDGSSEVCTRFYGITNVVKHFSVTNDKLYVLLESYDEDGERYEYGEIDLSTHNIVKTQSLYDDPDPWVFLAFSDAEGKQDFVVKMFLKENSTALYATDPGWESMTELYRIDAAEAERANFQQPDAFTYKIFTAWADAHYVMMCITGEQFVLYDLGSHTVQYIRDTGTPESEGTEPDVLHLDETEYTELDPGFTGTNFLGGQGSLHIPKRIGGFSPYGTCEFIYDETYYYSAGLIFPRSGNQSVEYSGNPDYEFDLGDHFLISDGERLYVTKNGAVNLIDSSGKLTSFFRLSDVGADEYEKYTGVIRIGNSYLFCGAGNVWVDENGRLLDVGFEYKYTGVYSGSPDSERSKYAYFDTGFRSTELIHLADPASGEKPLRFTLPDCREDCYTEEDGWFSAVAVDKFLYLDKFGQFCGYDPDTREKAVLAEAGSPDAEAMGYKCAVIDGKLYYMLADPYSEQQDQADLMQLDLNTGERQKLISFDIAELPSPNWIWRIDSKLAIEVHGGLALYDPATGELFRLQYN